MRPSRLSPFSSPTSKCCVHFLENRANVSSAAAAAAYVNTFSACGSLVGVPALAVRRFVPASVVMVLFLLSWVTGESRVLFQQGTVYFRCFMSIRWL